jgi:ABC-type phosphate transport system substrate-binding protein
MRAPGPFPLPLVAALVTGVVAMRTPSPAPSGAPAPATMVATAPAVAQAGFVMIANAANPATSISKLDATRIFLRKARAWPGSSLPADPVDQKESSPARKEFLSAVMGKDAAGMNAYWQSQLFVGRTTPPPVKGSDADVIAFVAAAKGGIGYVSAGVALPETVKPIKVGE